MFGSEYSNRGQLLCAPIRAIIWIEAQSEGRSPPMSGSNEKKKKHVIIRRCPNQFIGRFKYYAKRALCLAGAFVHKGDISLNRISIALFFWSLFFFWLL